MKTLYIECSMGAAGDMLTAALLEIAPHPEEYFEKINSLLPGVNVRRESVKKCGISGTHMHVIVHGEEEHCGDERSHSHDKLHIHDHTHEHSEAHEHEHTHEHGSIHSHEHEHHHYSLADIMAIIDSMDISENIKEHVRAVYKLIADAEADAHGAEPDSVHFHEVGAFDAIIDVTSVCLLIDQLAPEHIAASPIHVGSGHIHCAHGILPVPVPAVSYILRGIPTYGGAIDGELCTPTGAALVAHFAQSYTGMPVMRVDSVGRGMGSKDFPAANMLRVFIGQDESRSSAPNERICELCCNIDDMSSEALSYAADTLFKAGALDVFFTPITMKKSRPAQLMTCICRPDDSDSLAALILKHTTSFGVRRRLCDRYALDREFIKKATPYGDISIKHGFGYGIDKYKPEFGDVAAAAQKHGACIDDVIKAVTRS